MARKISKTSLAKHTKLLNKLFAEFNIKPTPEADKGKMFSNYPYQMQTKCGLLWIHPDSTIGHQVYSIFCRFEDPTKIPAELANSLGTVVTVNTYSGKMNFHDYCPEMIVGLARNAFKRIQIQPETT